jgi:uncharacterized protein
VRALLDINVLIALHDRDHIHHKLAANWFEANVSSGWASCPLTQNGFVRVMSQPSYSNPSSINTLLATLARSTSTSFHEHWNDDVSILDVNHFNHAHIHSQKNLTDVYLLGLVVKHKGRLVSFDQRISITSVIGAKANHLVIL